MRFKHQWFKGQQDKIFCPTDAFFYEISPEFPWILTCVFVKAFEGTCAHVLWACAGEKISAPYWWGSLVGKHRGIRRGSWEHPSHLEMIKPAMTGCTAKCGKGAIWNFGQCWPRPHHTLAAGPVPQRCGWGLLSYEQACWASLCPTFLY